MTRDFRQSAILPAPALPGPRRLVVRVLRWSALAFLLAGLWLYFARPDFLPPDAVPIVAFALVAVALSDWAAARLLRRIWSVRSVE